MEVSYKVDHAVLEENYNLKNGYGILHCSWIIISMHAHVSVKAFSQGYNRVLASAFWINKFVTKVEIACKAINLQIIDKTDPHFKYTIALILVVK